MRHFPSIFRLKLLQTIRFLLLLLLLQQELLCLNRLKRGNLCTASAFLHSLFLHSDTGSMYFAIARKFDECNGTSAHNKINAIKTCRVFSLKFSKYLHRHIRMHKPAKCIDNRLKCDGEHGDRTQAAYKC